LRGEPGQQLPKVGALPEWVQVFVAFQMVPLPGKGSMPLHHLTRSVFVPRPDNMLSKEGS
jgi:hypothetical protein